ncbi:MAG: rane protein [Solirubrobacteraceae bacterium]|nr:rane protein [Solirubrobacteraceae bacterium]
MSGRVVKSLDAYQRRHRWLGFPLAVLYKFGDDQGAYLTALITYYGFLSLFPLLLLLTTILGFVLQGDAGLQTRLVDSTLAELPIIGSQLRENVQSLKGSGVGLAFGILGTLYGCLGAAGAIQNAFNRVWAVPRNERPNPIKTRLRSLVLLLVLGFGVLLTTAISALTTNGGAFGASVGAWLAIAAIPLAALVNVGLFMLAFRVLTVSDVPTRHLRTGAVVAGVGWQVVQVLGSYYVARTLKGGSEAYGVFGLVLGLIAWIYLLALVIVFAAQINVVAQRRLWPRALLTPFTDQVELTSADERAYTGYAESERHKGFEVVDVGFEPPPADTQDRGE